MTFAIKARDHSHARIAYGNIPAVTVITLQYPRTKIRWYPVPDNPHEYTFCSEWIDRRDILTVHEYVTTMHAHDRTSLSEKNGRTMVPPRGISPPAFIFSLLTGVWHPCTRGHVRPLDLCFKAEEEEHFVSARPRPRQNASVSALITSLIATFARVGQIISRPEITWF